jgi:hypothetical protein
LRHCHPWFVDIKQSIVDVIFISIIFGGLAGQFNRLLQRGAELLEIILGPGLLPNLLCLGLVASLFFAQFFRKFSGLVIGTSNLSDFLLTGNGQILGFQ